MVSTLPSRFSSNTGKAESKPYSYSPPAGGQKSPQPQQRMQFPAESNLPLLLAAIALVIALASFYGAFFADKQLSESQKEKLLGIAEDLKALQDRDITMSAPVQTTIVLDRQYPIKDLFPKTFDLPLDFVIPVDAQVVGISSTGQPVSFFLDENVPIKATIPISSETAFGDNTIHLKKELPVEAIFSSSISVRAAYGQELNGIIDKLESIAGKSG